MNYFNSLIVFELDIYNIGMLGMQELFFLLGGGGRDIVVLMEYYVS